MNERAQRSTSMIQSESVWREKPAAAPDQVVLSRWMGTPLGRHALEFESDATDEHHALNICHRRPDADLIIGGRVVWTSSRHYDPYVLTGPRETRWEAAFRSSYETLRVYIPQRLIADCHTAMFGRPPAGAIKLMEAASLSDPGMRQLAHTFKCAYPSTKQLGPLFFESLGIALTCRMLRVYGSSTLLIEDNRRRPTRSSFAHVIDYIEDNLSQPLTLDSLSALSGLSKIYFLSEFKKAFGMPPHAYVVQRRIARAQELLERSNESMVAIALMLGFSSHSHLTTTFKRVVGRSPSEWRRARRD